ncbi:MAG: translocation/assembly module TamB domain-containing protein [Flavobacterium sp.]|nr:translocation/assembly module TamB domain-containing protein [Flavobacterium sp.]
MALNKHVKKGLKILAWTVGSIIGLFLLIVVLVQIPYFQNIIKDKAVSYLEDKIHTKVVIDHIAIGLPKKVVLEGFYFEDQAKDTLLYGKKLAVDISLFKLLDNEVEINSINLEGATAHINRNSESVFNFDYIIKAFASPKKEEDSSAPMKFSLHKVNLDSIKIKYNDAIAKNDLNFSLTHFDTKIEKFDLDNMNFEIPKIKIDGFKGLLKQGIAANTTKIAETTTQKTYLKLKIQDLDLSNIKVGYANDGSKLNFDTDLKKLLVKINSIDFEKQNIDIESIALENTKAAVNIGKQLKKATTVATSTAKSPNNWKVKINDGSFKNLALKFKDENAIPVKKGIDYKDLDISNFNLEAEKFSYSPNIISGTIASLTAKDKSGVDIQSLKTDFFYGEKGASLKNLYLKTPQTVLKDNIVVGYPSLDAVSKNVGELEVNANLSGSQLGFKDVLLFAPTLENTSPFKDNPNGIMAINSRVSGKVKDIQIPNLEISGIGNTKIAASGRIVGLPDVKNAYLDLRLRNFQSTSKDVNEFLPKGILPNTIALPTNFSAKGTFKGKINNFSTNMNVTSSFGNAKIKASFDRRVKNREKYDADATLDQFDVGKLLKNDSIGKISLSAKVKGIGLNPKTATANVDAKIIKADFNKYTYKNLNVKGKINNGFFDAVAGMNDPNLSFKLAADGSFKGKYPQVKLKMSVDIADLEKLNLHAGPLKLRGVIDADIPTADLDYLNGKVKIYDFTLATTDQFTLDTINVIATADAERNTMNIRSQFLELAVDGKYKLSQLPTALSNSIAKYYNTNQKAKKAKTEPQQLAFNLAIQNDPILLKIIPNLKGLEPINISGGYNSVGDTLVVNGTIPKVIYGANTISNAVLKINTENDGLTYGLVVDNIKNDALELPYTAITGNVKDNLVAYTLNLKDVKNKDQYLLSGTLEGSDGKQIVKLLPEGFLLNYENWAIPTDNRLILAKNGINIQNLELSNGGSTIKIQSESTTPDAPIALNFKDFKIETITSFIKKDKLSIGGNINGDALLKNLNTTATFTADLNIENFNFQKDTLGNINIKVNNEIANTLNAKVEITGQGNQVNLDGNYRTDTGALDMDLDINKLNLESIQGFTMGNVTESTGFLNGKFVVNGTVDAPKVNGKLQFNDIGLKISQLNSKFKDINDEITIDESGINLGKFTIYDENDNPLVLTGTINTTDFKDYGFDMNINADNFKAINSKDKDNDLYYGELYIDTKLKVRGDIGNPIVEGDVKINENTKFTVVLPQSDPSIEDREGIVEFVDRDAPKQVMLITPMDSIAQTKIKGINASVNIEIDKKAELSLIIDKSNGDFLKLKGEARLNGGIDPSGKTTLTGKYEFTEGSYEMTFNLIKRKFDIKEGSYILWTGEPTQATVSITAVYKTDAPPIDLLDDQLGDIAPEIRNTYKQKIPFETELKMNGDLMKPDITFDIVLPDGNNSVSADIINNTQTKLAQLRTEPSELNKQVFALLLLNRFIGENPFASEADGANANSLARQSVSKILSQQLNNLAGDLINGFELSFDLESTEDYTTGTKENRTDLNVGISKKLLNDRLKVTVGSSFGLEKSQESNQETNNIAGDVSVDYQITKDGRYMVRAYRKNEYEVALQGEVIETGVAFIITISYNKFRELFHRTQEEKDLAENERREKREKKEREKAKAAKQKADETNQK